MIISEVLREWKLKNFSSSYSGNLQENYCQRQQVVIFFLFLQRQAENDINRWKKISFASIKNIKISEEMIFLYTVGTLQLLYIFHFCSVLLLRLHFSAQLFLLKYCNAGLVIELAIIPQNRLTSFHFYIRPDGCYGLEFNEGRVPTL